MLKLMMHCRLPAELLQHLEFGLVEPNTESMRGEIPFTNVQTARPVKVRANYVQNGNSRSRHNSGGSHASHARKM